MSRVLTIMEVSKKQEYIFGSNKLRDNVIRSAEIAYVTDSRFFQAAAPDLYREKDNLVYSGGGHAVLQFDSMEQARAFSKRVTETVLMKNGEMEIFVKSLLYNEALTAGENLTALAAALERKKAERKNSFRWMSIGLESLSRQNYRPVKKGARNLLEDAEIIAPPEGYEYPHQFTEIAGDDNFIAVVHIDGNAMGKRVSNLYERCGNQWEECRKSLDRFSRGIQADFETAFKKTVHSLLHSNLLLEKGKLPVRPLILAGDDVCFITSGKIGLETARIFLEHLSGMENQEDGRPYAACAGVALVHQKYPFHRAYDLAEELCSSAKKYGAAIDPEGRISAMDWHIEFGQLKDGLSQIRREYETEDSGEDGIERQLNLRPVTVIIPESAQTAAVPKQKTYAYFRNMSCAVKDGSKNIARSKIKEFRTALKQGTVEADYYLQSKAAKDLLYWVFDAKYTGQERQAAYCDIEVNLEKMSFVRLNGESKECCQFFDAIEMIDHWCALEVKE